MSLPIPRRQGTNPTVAFLFYKANPQMLEVAPPRWIVEVDVSTRSVARSEEIVPNSWGLQALPTSVRPRRLVGSSPEERKSHCDQFIEAAEKLAPAFWTGVPVDSALRADAERYLAWFPQLSENGMAEIYEAVGREWFTWLRAQAGGR
jgi:hypothetical protein